MEILSTTNSYSPTVWKNNQDPPISDQNLNRVESELVSLHNRNNLTNVEVNNHTNIFNDFSLRDIKKDDSDYQLIFKAGSATEYIGTALSPEIRHARNTQKIDTIDNWKTSTFIPAEGELIIATGTFIIKGDLEWDSDEGEYISPETPVQGFKIYVGDGVHSFFDSENQTIQLNEYAALQGPAGREGKAVTLSIDEVITLNANKNAQVTVTPDALDHPTHIPYKLDFSIPRGYGARFTQVNVEETISGSTASASLGNTILNAAGGTYDHILNLKIPRPYDAKIGTVTCENIDPSADPSVESISRSETIGTHITNITDLKFKLPKAPTIEVDTISTVSANENATVENVGNEYKAKFKFNIPRGYSTKINDVQITSLKSDQEPSASITPDEVPTGDWYNHELSIGIPLPYIAQISSINTEEVSTSTTPEVELNTLDDTFVGNQGYKNYGLNFKLPKAPTISIDSDVGKLNANQDPKVTLSDTEDGVVLKFDLPKAPTITAESHLIETKGTEPTLTITEVNDGGLHLNFGLSQPKSIEEVEVIEDTQYVESPVTGEDPYSFPVNKISVKFNDDSVTALGIVYSPYVKEGNWWVGEHNTGMPATTVMSWGTY